jgi:hypothetical protein
VRRLLVVLGLFTSLSAAAQDEDVVVGAIRVEGLAAVVGGLAPSEGVISILRSDVEFRARVALAGAGATDAALTPIPPSLLKASFEELLGEALIASEASRISLAAPSAEDLRDERERFAVRAGGEASLAKLRTDLGVSTRELDALVRRRAVVSAFLKANLEGTLEVTPGELAQAYGAMDHPFRDEPLEQVEPALRTWLTQRRLEQSVGRWVDALKARMPHRILASY